MGQGIQADLVFDAVGDAATAVAASRLTAWGPAQWHVAPDWQPLLDHFLAGDAGQSLGRYLQARLAAGALIYPPEPLRALALTSLRDVRVLILGQDPYHGPGQAEGLAFSVAPGVRPPPSLRNIFLEIARDLAVGPAGSAPKRAPLDGSLVRWAAQGVLLLNTCLTVEAGQAASHARRGWEALTDAVVRAVAARPTPVVFMLWGAHAQAKQVLLTGVGEAQPHLVLTANHPSPLSARRPPQPFLGCGHFGQANAFLQQHGGRPIIW
jgi:uracil-DNA glycosylase